MKYICNLILLSLCGIVIPYECFPQNVKSPPNVIIILADDMGYSDLGCYGGEINTPHLNSLAEDGIRFTQFYNAARCCPTRASLMTGLYPHAAGMGGMTPPKWEPRSSYGPSYQGYINKEAITIAEALKEADYQTAMVGKWHVGDMKEWQWPENRGFDWFYGIHHYVDSYWKVTPECEIYHDGKLVVGVSETPKNELHPDKEFYTTDVFTDWALKYIDDAHQGENPLFLYVAYNSPHWPLEAPSEDISKYDGVYDEGWKTIRDKKFRKMKEMGIIPGITEISKEEFPQWESLSEEDQKNTIFRRQIYAAQVDRMDQNIGRIIQQLNKNGMLHNTLILFLSDNGCSDEGGMLGYKFESNRINNYEDWRKQSVRSASQGQAWSNVSNTPFRKHKKFAYEGGIRTPLIVHWPDGIRNPGRLSDEPGHIVDIYATILEISKQHKKVRFKNDNSTLSQRISLLPVLKNKKPKSHSAIFSEHWESASVRVEDWKLVTADYKDPTLWELFYMEKDPAETVNLRTKYPEKTKKLFKLFAAWAKEMHIQPEPSELE